MPRDQVTVEREEAWGTLRYDTRRHVFTYSETAPRGGEPYATQPVLLNVVVTRRCNMDCTYCVAKDFTGIEEEDLVLSADMIRWINRSPFMVLVLTGGEPLMPPYDEVSLRLINGVRDRGLILDTNGTILPDRRVLSILKKKRVMVRVSIDSSNPEEEIEHRRLPGGHQAAALHTYYTKLANIERFVSAGICTAVQTVVWRKEQALGQKMVSWLRDRGVHRWYLQRLIPSYRVKAPQPRFYLTPAQYCSDAAKVASVAHSMGLECVAKMDLRHNSVFLLTANGALYTQGSAPGQKLPLGTIKDRIEYFNYVSQADHAWRYYLAERPQEKRGAARQ